MDTNFVVFALRWTGSSLLLTAEAVAGYPQSFTLHGLQPRRFRYEHEALLALERAGVGYWSEFPPDHIQATVTRQQLLSIGFRGVY